MRPCHFCQLAMIAANVQPVCYARKRPSSRSALASGVASPPLYGLPQQQLPAMRTPWSYHCTQDKSQQKKQHHFFNSPTPCRLVPWFFHLFMPHKWTRSSAVVLLFSEIFEGGEAVSYTTPFILRMKHGCILIYILIKDETEYSLRRILQGSDSKLTLNGSPHHHHTPHPRVSPIRGGQLVDLCCTPLRVCGSLSGVSILARRTSQKRPSLATFSGDLESPVSDRQPASDLERPSPTRIYTQVSTPCQVHHLSLSNAQLYFPCGCWQRRCRCIRCGRSGRTAYSASAVDDADHYR
jgi:hypothetical protein